MSKKNYLHFIASFLIVLVLTIPFYTTSVYATINSVSVKGSDGIEGFAKATDFLNFDVQASISSDTITNDRVVLGSAAQFDKCAASINNGSECTLRFPGNGTENFESKSAAFTINLYKDDKTLDDSKSGSITVDSKAPQVKLSSKPKFSSQQNVIIGYDVTDFACDDPSCSSKCVGIKNIDLYTQDGAFKQTINPVTSSCSVKSNISIDSKAFNDGKNSVFAKATDKFNQVSSETSVTFDVDSTGPSVVADSFEILRKGISISTFSSNGVNVDVAVNISGNDLDLNSVRADLSALNPSQNLKNAKASCTSASDGVSTCKWNIELNPGTGGLKNIVINASDTSGNKESATITKLLSIDDKGPAVLSMATGLEKEGQFLAKASGNTVIAAFDEATGLSPEDVFLNVGSRKIRATSCSKEANWFCIWSSLNFAGAARVSVDPGSLDILGIDATGDVFLDVALDNNAPVLKSINITNVGGITQAFPGFAKIGDKISVVADMAEDNDLSAVADFSKFISGASQVAGQCERIQADEHMCTWLTDSINLQASDIITFNFSDSAGNTLIVTRPFKTFGVENATVPDFWSNTVTCSPTTIDRSIGPLINQKVYCQVNLKQKSGAKPVSTIFIGPAACSGDASIVQSVETLKKEVGSNSPVIKVTLKKGDFKINKADLSCSFSIFSKIGSATDITKNPEIENAKISLQFANLPLGELSEEISGKIQDAKDEAEGIYKLIGTLNKIVNYAKKICQFLQTFYNIVGVLYFVVHALNIAGIGLESTPVTFLSFFTVTPTAIKTCGIQTSARQVTGQGLLKYGDQFCKLVNCQTTFLWGPIVKDWIDNPTKYFGNAGYLASPGQYLGPKSDYLGPKSDGQPSTIDYVNKISIGQGGQPRPVSEYMDPNHNLIVATLFACLPGIIYGLDKYRQIKCLYADCLQNAVGKDGLPVTACEDQKAYATCKYITSELFAVFPWTAVFDHFMAIIKNALSNPLSALGAGISLGCQYTCPILKAEPRQIAWTACETFRLFSQIGYVANNVKNIIDEGFTIRTDYCQRLEDNDSSKEEPSSKSTNSTAKK